MNVTKFQNLRALNVYHGVYGRQAGGSSGPYSSLNIGFHVGDDESNVYKNRQKIKEHLQIEKLISAKQVHGKEVLVVDKEPVQDREFEGYDALVTNVSGIGLMIQQADCQAVLLYDPVKRAAANIHSGWRGSVQNIIAETVTVMKSVFGTRPGDVVAAISPSLGPCCSEFLNYKKELPESFHPYQARANHFDFWRISRDQLISAGLDIKNIEISGICTVCNENYFSYRREGVTGRFATVISLPPGLP